MAVGNAEKETKRHYEPPCEEKEIDFHPLAMDLYSRIGPAFESGIHTLISLIAQRRGTSPAQQRSKLQTRFVSRAIKLIAVGMNRRRLVLLQFRNIAEIAALTQQQFQQYSESN